MSTDPFVHFDGPYVLGALSAEDRQAYEEHLPSCPDCTAAVRELAGLPGLLSQLPQPDQLPQAPEPELLTGLLATVRKTRRRRTRLAASVAAAAAACLAVLLLGPLLGTTEIPGVARATMSSVDTSRVTGAVAISNTRAGMTKVDMTCSYTGGGGGEYLLVAVRTNGTEQTLATWYAIPGDTARIALGTKLAKADIDRLEVRLPTGAAVLTLDT
ncbi:putative zinc finger protein [Tamaricihabitans halophyticus]|uniref:Putative zinc finger protein n=1 Tax=Tamaricihabitans halophyticus TaxID=1262583 RepID=A0A4R2R3W7_9PSEU|nr:zf-HC2 domain-containing protein [Tamaricihabitans halophyticus]TCP54075.1 putative zinc finger protein [Tamaricihabitans halophyticus]